MLFGQERQQRRGDTSKGRATERKCPRLPEDGQCEGSGFGGCENTAEGDIGRRVQPQDRQCQRQCRVSVEEAVRDDGRSIDESGDGPEHVSGLHRTDNRVGAGSERVRSGDRRAYRVKSQHQRQSGVEGTSAEIQRLCGAGRRLDHIGEVLRDLSRNGASR